MTIKTTIQVRRDTASNWTSVNPTLAAGEIGYITSGTNATYFKIGNGTSAWNDLPFQNMTGPTGATGPQGPAGASIAIKGVVSTVGSLPSSGNSVNDAYVVSADGHLYVWSSSNSWTDIGQFQGTPGTNGTNGTNGVGYDGITSSSSVTIGTGSKSLTLNKIGALVVGSRVRAAVTTAPTTFIEGVITSISTLTIAISVDVTSGSGSASSWNISIAGIQGAKGDKGDTGSNASVSVSGTPLTYSSGIIGIQSTSDNTLNWVVQRDGNGNFSAGTIAATLRGNLAATSISDGKATFSNTSSNSFTSVGKVFVQDPAGGNPVNPTAGDLWFW